MRRRTLAAGALIALAVGWTTPAAAQQFVLPWEEAERAKPQVDPEKVEAIIVTLGKLEVRHLPVPGKAVISSHPEIAEVVIESPNLLFIMGRFQGETVVVIADENNNPVYTARIRVEMPEHPDAKYR
ncbi:pilus assembly protein N-terminal domain-containing protein [Novispirillum sp. DQ9]|uniref:pilus assembly protein N-terminal domain-containing protein n=1 Tax=Novispirillum sp. DQ9 TaxID=3398612 RepID=UPI003C7DEF59